MLVRMQYKDPPCALLLLILNGEAIIENSMEAPQKFKSELPYDPTISLLGIYPK